MKEKLKNMRAAIAIAVSALLVIGVTVAYMTSSEVTANVFTVGEVSIELTEPEYPGDNTDETTDMTSNSSVAKDPVITNTGENDIVVFIRINIPMDEVVIATSGGENNGEKLSDSAINQELFQFTTDENTYNDISLVGYGTLTNSDGSSNIWDENWLLLGTLDESGSWTDYITYIDEDGNETTYDQAAYASYLFGYSKILGVGEKTSAVFNYVRLVNAVEGYIDSSEYDIQVLAYAIQADNISGISTDSLTADVLRSIYQVFLNQSAKTLSQLNVIG